MDMTNREFELFMDRFDQVERLIREGQEKLVTHQTEDQAIHEVVSRHATYWQIFIYVISTIFIASIGWALTK